MLTALTAFIWYYYYLLTTFIWVLIKVGVTLVHILVAKREGPKEPKIHHLILHTLVWLVDWAV